jgi:hypothetical protein
MKTYIDNQKWAHDLSFTNLSRERKQYKANRRTLVSCYAHHMRGSPLFLVNALRGYQCPYTCKKVFRERLGFRGIRNYTFPWNHGGTVEILE